jgi:hypothetical protein
MFGGLDPTKLAAAKKIGDHVTAQLHIDEQGGTFTLKLTGKDEEGKQATGQLAKQLAMGIAQQLKMFFNIKGEIV